MKVLLFIKRLDFGGAENHVVELANELNAQGHEVLLLCQKGRNITRLNKEIQLIYRSVFSNCLLVQIVQLLWLVSAKKCQIIHAHQRFPILAASIAGFLTGVPVVATVHGRTRYDLRSYLSRKLPSLFVFVSYSVLQKSKYNSQIRDKSVVIPNGISIVDKRYNLIAYSMAYISRIDAAHSNVILLILNAIPDLFKTYEQLRFYIYGDGPNLDIVKEKAEKANRLIGFEVVKLCGFKSDLHSNSSFPELVMGVGRVAIEAGLKACTLISVNNKRMGQLIHSENYLKYKLDNFVNTSGLPPTTEMIYQEIARFFADREAYRKQSLALMERFSDDFSITTMVETLVGEYQRLLND